MQLARPRQRTARRRMSVSPRAQAPGHAAARQARRVLHRSHGHGKRVVAAPTGPADRRTLPTARPGPAPRYARVDYTRGAARGGAGRPRFGASQPAPRVDNPVGHGAPWQHPGGTRRAPRGRAHGIRSWRIATARRSAAARVDPAHDRVSDRPPRRGRLALDWDEEVSRVHAVLEHVAGSGPSSTTGCRKNGTFVGGLAVAGRQRLGRRRAAVGHTRAGLPRPGPRRVATDRDGVRAARRSHVSPMRAERVLVALCRPSRGRRRVRACRRPTSSIADELFLTVDAVKSHLRALFEKFGVRRHCRRTASARWSSSARCTTGMVTERDLRRPREQRPQPPERLGDLRLGDDERREEAERARAGGVDDEPLLEQRAAREVGRVGVDLGGQHQPAPADPRHPRQLAQPLGQQRRRARAPLEEAPGRR